jgi:hypothetical protein
MDGGPVPGRECGACDYCCVVFENTIPEIAKPAGTRCRNLTAGGCAIYETRPDMCAKWLCGWRLIPGLPENWRPDLSGILVYQQVCAQPDYGATALVLALKQGQESMHDPVLQGFVQAMVSVRVPIYLALIKDGVGPSVFLNPELEAPGRGRAEVLAVLQRAVAQLGG